MDTFSPDIDGNNSPFKRDIEIIRRVLESGNSVELPATGFSMFPTLRPDDRVIVKPISKSELPKTGNVIVYDNNGVLVMHRLIKIIGRNDTKPLFITRGDSGIEQDMPWTEQQLVGVAVSYNRADKEHSVRSYIPGVWRYEYNRRMLWIYLWVKD